MSESKKVVVKVSKIRPKENVSAFLENRTIVRDTLHIECDEQVLVKIISNYLIVKKIICNLSWQEQLLCKFVCRMWCDAVRTLQRELLSPEEFVVTDLHAKSVQYKASNIFTTEPLAIINFANLSAFNTLIECKKFSSITRCTCNERHSVIDLIDQTINSPKQCMLTIKTDYLSYMPTSQSPTAKYTVKRNMMSTLNSFSAGIVIPKIPDVNYHLIDIKLQKHINEEFFDPINKICETQYIKGILVFITDKYFLQSIEDVAFLNNIKDLQPDMSYAIGGCIIDDTLSSNSDLLNLIDGLKADNRYYLSEYVMSMAVFTVRKEQNESETTSKSNFEMFSLVIESSEWSKPKIKKAIDEFSESVPRFEHSVVLKLSCIGRDKRHDVEQDLFRQVFPDTPLVGCYGNGELGVNHPPRNLPEPPPNTVKRLKSENDQFSVMYSYSTIFVYFGWGKITPQ